MLTIASAITMWFIGGLLSLTNLWLTIEYYGTAILLVIFSYILLDIYVF